MFTITISKHHEPRGGQPGKPWTDRQVRIAVNGVQLIAAAICGRYTFEGWKRRRDRAVDLYCSPPWRTSDRFEAGAYMTCYECIGWLRSIGVPDEDISRITLVMQEQGWHSRDFGGN